MIALWIILGVIAVLPAVAYICGRIAFYVSPAENRDPHVLLPGKQYQELKEQIVPLINSAVEIPYTDVWIRSDDGLRLHGAYYEVKKGAPLEIMVHGYRSIALRDFCGALQFTLNGGHNVLLIDQRAHGVSEGRYLTFGVRERMDCLAWVRYAREQFGEDIRIILVGVSMGAATVLMTADLDLPEQVVGIIADSSYSSPKAIIRKCIRDMRLPVGPAYAFAAVGARLFAGFDPDAASAVRAVRNARVPILLIHGEADTFVPCEMSREIFDACAGKKTLLTVPGADHGLEYLIDNRAYMDALHRFLDEIGCPAESGETLSAR